jgi:RNA polymerase sigma-70 factor (ECF subfamily)
MNGSVTLPAALASVFGVTAPAAEEAALDQSRELERFLADVERRAFKIANIAVRDIDDALDIVQDAMMQLARRYGARPCAEWKPIFYRILKNRIRDCQRRRTVRARVLVWFPRQHDPDDDPLDMIESAPASGPAPGEQLQAHEALQALEHAIGELPARQQQAFLLRNLEGLDVVQTAAAMGCSQGSVKTHYFRALQTLRERLGEFWS